MVIWWDRTHSYANFLSIYQFFRVSSAFIVFLFSHKCESKNKRRRKNGQIIKEIIVTIYFLCFTRPPIGWLAFNSMQLGFYYISWMCLCIMIFSLHVVHCRFPYGHTNVMVMVNVKAHIHRTEQQIKLGFCVLDGLSLIVSNFFLLLRNSDATLTSSLNFCTVAENKLEKMKNKISTVRLFCDLQIKWAERSRAHMNLHSTHTNTCMVYSEISLSYSHK